MGIVIYYKSRPKFESTQIDLLEYSKCNSKLFMPYPAFHERKGKHSDYPQDLIEDRLNARSTMTKQERGVTNLINKVDACNPDSDRWAMIPRLGNGKCWIAKIKNKYTVWPGNSDWIGEIGKSHTSLGYEELADVAQGWDTEDWKEVPFSYFPRWFSKQLLSQTSYGSIHPLKDYPNHSFYPLPEEIVASAYSDRHTSHLPESAPADIGPAKETILARLVERLSPTLFELLCVELLQLDPDASACSWMHVAGAGDGGADGIGFDTVSGQPRLVLQAKWQISRKTPISSDVTHLTYLVGTPPDKGSGTGTVWGPDVIASKVITHWSELSGYFRRSLS